MIPAIVAAEKSLKNVMAPFKKPLFITFEGIDGCGKTTQSQLLTKHFRKAGAPSILTFDPGGSPISKKIRRILLSKSNANLNHQTELFLYLAARSQLIEETIFPALGSGKHVICDRFIDATVAYQGFGRGFDLALIRKFNRLISGHCKPDLTFYLHIPLKTSIIRQKNKTLDRLESAGQAFFRRVIKGYLALCRENPNRIALLNGTKPTKVLSNEIWDRVKKKL